MPTNPNSIGNPFGNEVTWGPKVKTAQENALAAAEAKRAEAQAKADARAQKQAADKAVRDAKKAQKEAVNLSKAPATKFDIDTIFGAIGDVLRDVGGLKNQVGDVTGLNQLGSPKATPSGQVGSTSGLSQLKKYAPVLVVLGIVAYVFFTSRKKRN